MSEPWEDLVYGTSHEGAVGETLEGDFVSYGEIYTKSTHIQIIMSALKLLIESYIKDY